MAIRVLLFLFTLFLLTNIVITLVSVICGVNLYKKHGNTILKGYGIFILFIVAVYVVMALLGLN
jgi:hypothetical protein